MGLPEALAGACKAVLTGRSGSGKTSAAECAASRLAGRGVRLLYVKYTHHGVDLPGKDTWRVTRAGAVAALAVGPEGAVLVAPGIEPGELAATLAAFYDAVILEGFRAAAEAYPDPIDVESLGPEGACREAVERIESCLAARGGGRAGP